MALCPEVSLSMEMKKSGFLKQDFTDFNRLFVDFWLIFCYSFLSWSK